MTYAYDEKYLDVAVRNLGEAFDYAVNACHIDADEFMGLFISSGYADAFGHGNPRLVAGLSGSELVMEILTDTGLDINFPEPIVAYSCSRVYWCGWILTYTQWSLNRSFRDIHRHISMQEILCLYSTMHEASEDRFVDTAIRIINRRDSISKLQQQRKICGYSQRELAEKSGVNLRTLQQYELGSKDIGKASVSNVIAMASVLGCRVEDIVG